APAQPAAACTTGPIPVYPGAVVAGGAERFGDVTSLGRTYVRTDATIQFIQQFYYARLPNYGWAQQPLLPGQYAMQFATEGSNPTGGAEDELDFARGNGNESVRIVAEGGGYSIILACRD